MWLRAGGAALPDTCSREQVAAGAELRSSRITAIASGLMTIALLVLVVARVPAAWNFRKSYAKVSDLLDRVYGDINPIMRHASAIADNVNYITTSMRTDVQQVNATIAAANERLQQAVAVTEQRLGEFNALLAGGAGGGRADVRLDGVDGARRAHGRGGALRAGDGTNFATTRGRGRRPARAGSESIPRRR